MGGIVHIAHVPCASRSCDEPAVCMICARHAPRAAGRCDKSRRAGAGPRAGGDGGAAVVWRHNGGFGAGRGLGAAGLVGRQLAEHEAGEAERAQMLLHPLQQGRVAHHGESPPGEQRGQMARVRRVGTVRGGGEGEERACLYLRGIEATSC